MTPTRHHDHPTVAAALIVRNEAERLPTCLEALRWVDQLVVVDDGSTDDTVAIAERYGATVLHRRRDRVDTQRNVAADASTCDWVLAVDADEWVTPDLAAEVRRVIAAPDAPDVFALPFRHRLLGRWPRHGGWDQPLTRLARRHVRWAGPEHAQLVAIGSVGVLQAPMLHFSHDSLADFLTKLNRYTETEAEVRLAEGRPWSVWKMILSPLRDFWRRYVLAGGWRDGTYGFILCALMAIYLFVERAKHWERRHPANEPWPESVPVEPLAAMAGRSAER